MLRCRNAYTYGNTEFSFLFEFQKKCAGQNLVSDRSFDVISQKFMKFLENWSRNLLKKIQFFGKLLHQFEVLKLLLHDLLA